MNTYWQVRENCKCELQELEAKFQQANIPRRIDLLMEQLKYIELSLEEAKQAKEFGEILITKTAKKA